MPDYQQGKIYKVLNTIDNEIYAGSTCEALSQRMARHRSTPKRNTNCLIHKHMSQLGVEHFYIELIMYFPCNRNEELVKREGEIIRSIGTLNKCGTINIKENMFEYHKQYHHDYLDKRKEQKHIWYEKTRSILRNIMKQTRNILRNSKKYVTKMFTKKTIT